MKNKNLIIKKVYIFVLFFQIFIISSCYNNYKKNIKISDFIKDIKTNYGDNVAKEASWFIDQVFWKDEKNFNNDLLNHKSKVFGFLSNKKLKNFEKFESKYNKSKIKKQKVKSSKNKLTPDDKKELEAKSFKRRSLSLAKYPSIHFLDQGRGSRGSYNVTHCGLNAFWNFLKNFCPQKNLNYYPETLLLPYMVDNFFSQWQFYQKVIKDNNTYFLIKKFLSDNKLKIKDKVDNWINVSICDLEKIKDDDLDSLGNQIINLYKNSNTNTKEQLKEILINLGIEEKDITLDNLKWFDLGSLLVEKLKFYCKNPKIMNVDRTYIYNTFKMFDIIQTITQNCLTFKNNKLIHTKNKNQIYLATLKEYKKNKFNNLNNAELTNKLNYFIDLLRLVQQDKYLYHFQWPQIEHLDLQTQIKSNLNDLSLKDQISEIYQIVKKNGGICMQIISFCLNYHGFKSYDCWVYKYIIINKIMTHQIKKDKIISFKKNLNIPLEADLKQLEEIQNSIVNDINSEKNLGIIISTTNHFITYVRHKNKWVPTDGFSRSNKSVYDTKELLNHFCTIEVRDSIVIQKDSGFCYII